MKILIFGATGGTGKELVQQGLAQGHDITAFVRNPSKFSIKGKNLFIVQGDVRNTEDVEKALNGQQVVISALGIKTSKALWKPNTIISDGIINIVSAMKKQKVKRILFLASFGVNEDIFYPEKLFIRTVLKNIFADIPRQEKLIKESGLDWTIIHPARLVNTPKTGVYKSAEHLPIGLFSKISRADVADFILKEIEASMSIRKTITMSY